MIPKAVRLWTVAVLSTLASIQGRIVFEGPVPSKVLATNRFVRIYLPPSYNLQPQRRFPVLYLHDGQNVFTTAGPNAAFGWGNWQLDRTADELSAAGRMQEIIMVAIDCSQDRYLDYRGPAYPYSPADLAERKRALPAPADDSRYRAYGRFLMRELKPKIDREYRTLSGPSTTGMMGSSMGGICSLALAWEHPKVFGLAASLSGAFQVERRQFLVGVLRLYEGKPKRFRVYLDSGVVDYSGGDDGRKNTTAVAQELRRIGWRDGINLLHYTDDHPLSGAELEGKNLSHDKWSEAQTSQHNEFYWRLRAWRALNFLFPP
jgi:enterochelin esterase-like enzyme